jgi:hypothetical protein
MDTTETKKAKRRLWIELAVAYFVFLGALYGCTLWFLRAKPGAPWKYLIGAVPVVWLACVSGSMTRFIRCLDELKQKIALDTLAFAFAGTLILTFAYGFLENFGVPRLSWIHVPLVMAACVIAGSIIAKARYR